jgi:(4S)-4-hydroxy-5-phosphonooxypentane-2,3-dione isomerase
MRLILRLLPARSITSFGRCAAVLAGSLSIAMAVASGARAQTSGGPLYAVTYLDVAANSVSQGVSILKKYRDLSSHEAGNLEFTVLQERIRPNRFVIFEGWKDQAAFDAHSKGAPASECQEALAPIRNSPPYQMMQYAFVTAPPRANPARDALYMVEHMDFMPTFATTAAPLVKALAEHSEKEESVIRYDAYHWGNHHYMIMAVWPDSKAFDAHEAASYTRQFRAAAAVPGGRIDLYEERLYNRI